MNYILINEQFTISKHFDTENCKTIFSSVHSNDSLKIPIDF